MDVYTHKHNMFSVIRRKNLKCNNAMLYNIGFRVAPCCTDPWNKKENNKEPNRDEESKRKINNLDRIHTFLTTFSRVYLRPTLTKH